MRWPYSITYGKAITRSEIRLSWQETKGWSEKGAGRLTDKLIDTLQTYYGMAIRQHGDDLQGIAKAIWAGIMHRVSTDDAPQHQFCPIGKDAWCGWQRSKAGSEEVYSHQNILPQAIFELVKPIYLALADKVSS